LSALAVAAWPAEDHSATRLLHVDPARNAFHDGLVSDLTPLAVAAVERARGAGGRVVAVGTTVVRALEGAWRDGGLRALVATTDLRIGPGFEPRVVSGLLTGLHEPGESHFELLQAFAARALLEAAVAHAAAAGYRGHEFGDASLVLAGG